MNLENMLSYHFASTNSLDIVIVDILKNCIIKINEDYWWNDAIDSIFKNISFYSSPRKIKENTFCFPIIHFKQIVAFILLRKNVKFHELDKNLLSFIADLIASILKMEYNFSYLNIKISEKFTTREKEVISQILCGKKDKEIAKNLCISLPSVRKHIRSIYEKESVKTKHEFILKYFSNN